MTQRIQRAAWLGSAGLLVLALLVLAVGIDDSYRSVNPVAHVVNAVVMPALAALLGWRLWRCWHAGAVLLDLGWAPTAVPACFVASAFTVLALLTGLLWSPDHVNLAVYLLVAATSLVQGLGRIQVRERGIVACPQYVPWELIATYTLNAQHPDFSQTAGHPEHVFLSLRFKRRWFHSRSLVLPGDQREALEHVLGRYVASSSV
jgi:hypothetical protein